MEITAGQNLIPRLDPSCGGSSTNGTKGGQDSLDAHLVVLDGGRFWVIWCLPVPSIWVDIEAGSWVKRMRCGYLGDLALSRGWP